MTTFRYVDLDGAEPDGAVVVIDVLRAFTVVPWLFHRGAGRVVAVAGIDTATAVRDHALPDAWLAGESGGRPLPGFDLGNSPSEVARTDLAGRPVVHRTSAGTQGLVRTVGSDLALAASFAVATATARVLAAHRPDRVTFVVTGASLGRDGDEDLACAEYVAALVAASGAPVDARPFLERVPRSDAGRHFSPDGPDWAPPADLELACELDRFDHALLATPVDGLLPDDDTPHPTVDLHRA